MNKTRDSKSMTLAQRRADWLSWHDSGRGPALVLLNGWSASGLAWPRSFITALESTFRVVRPDNRGSGWSREAPTPFTMKELADDVDAILDVLDIDSALVVGLSMGGMIAQELAIQHPDRVQSLVLVATRPPAPAYAVNLRDAQRLLRKPVKGQTVPEHIAQMWADSCAPGFADANPAAIAELTEQILRRPTPRSALLAQTRAVTGWHSAERLRSITAPTIVVHGDLDPLTPVRNGVRLSQLIPGARYEEQTGVGHLVPLEAPEPLIELIREAAAVSTQNAAVGDVVQMSRRKSGVEPIV
jgi:3-oxoadipate enol-lactonase